MSDDKSNYINNLKFYIYILSKLHVTNLLIRLIMIIRGLFGKYPTCRYIVIPVGNEYSHLGRQPCTIECIENR